MATTLQDLVAGLPDDLLPTGPLPTAVTRVTGVHVSELLDPTPFLVGGELLLTTGLSLTTHLTRLVDYVTRLRGAGVVALGFGVGPVHAALPPPLQAACERAGLPLLVVPTRSRFQTVVAAFWQREREAERQDLHGALGSTHALVRAATQGPGDRGRTRARVVRALATGVGGWAAHLDADGRAGTAWPMTARPMARRAGEYVQRLRSAAVAGATFPLDHDDVLLQPIAGAEGGYLACGCTRPIPQRMRHLTLAACAVLDLHASRLAPHVALQEALPSVLGQLVVLGHAGAARDVAAAQGRPWPAAVRVSVAEHPRTANGRELPGSPLVAWAAGSAGLAWHAETTSGLWGAGRAQGAAPRRANGPVSSGRTPTERNARPATERLVLISPPDLPPQPPPAPARGLRGPVVPAEHCAVEVARLLPLLATLSPGQWQALDPPGPPGAAATLVSSALRAVQDYPRTDLLATLAAYLRHRGRHEECAGELGIHRNTLRHRLRLLRTLLHDTVDTDLDDPDLSAHLWLGLRERGLA